MRGDNVPDAAGHIAHLLLAHRRIKGQGQNPREQIERAPAGLGGKPLSSEERMNRNRNEMYATAHTAFAELFDEGIPVDLQTRQVQAQYIQMPRVTDTFSLGWKLELSH